MDKEISPGERNKRHMKQAVAALLLLAACAMLLFWGLGSLRPRLNRARIQTARVERGAIESSISASGLVEPELEHILSSPIDTRVVRILKSPGSAIRRGEAIFELDISQSRLALDRLEQQIGLKRNELERAQLDLENALTTLRNQLEVRKLELESAQADTSRARSLYQEKLVPDTSLVQATLQEKKAQAELNDVEEKIRHAQRSTQVQLAGLEMGMRILEKERDEAQRELQLATTTSDRDGILTWVIQQEGTSVRKGDVLARTADLSAFHVTVTVSDIHSARLSQGLPVLVRIGETALQGHVRQILPTIKDGIISLIVQLEAPAHELLKSNLRVDVEIILQRKARTLRIRRGPGIEPEGPRQLFVLRGDRAVRTAVELGVSSFDNCEILSGLAEGDEVIITDMKDYQHLQEIRIQ